ncbi:MAG TPA: hypothetical protein VES20_20555, partial [Bryobacteraceae bacterium]|nr:hypothetical protein [Bryobacteraceae bacterium]
MSKVAAAETQAAVAKKFRQRLEAESAPDFHDYELLWGLEFRTQPPQAHGELRKRVAKDVERLLALKPDKRYLGVILSGLKQSAALKEEVTAFEDRLHKEAPASGAAYSVTFERWKRAHKEPEDHKDAAAWGAWKKANLEANRQWKAQFTDVNWLERSWVSAAIDAGELSEAEAVAALQRSIDDDLRRHPPSPWTYADPAHTLLNTGWAPAAAADWLAKAWPLAIEDERRSRDDDTLTDERRKEMAEGSGFKDMIGVQYLRALSAARRKEIPESLRAWAEQPMPAKRADWSQRYLAKAYLAALDGHPADRLAYLQQALFTREKVPQHFRGKLTDTLLDEARTAFLKTGGSENAFAIWSQRPEGAQQLAEGRWEKPKKTIPSFELSDISGKKWTL